MVEPKFFRATTPQGVKPIVTPQRLRIGIGVVVVALLALGLWAVLHGGSHEPPLTGENEQAANPPAGPGAPSTPANNPTPNNPQPPKPTETQIAAEGHVPVEAPKPEVVARSEQQKLADQVAAADKLYTEQSWLAARNAYNAVVDKGLPKEANDHCVARLSDLADKTVFSMLCAPGDTVTEYYKVPSGSSYWKISQIYRLYKGQSNPEVVSLLEKINRIPARGLRAEQKIKVVKGPFNVVVDKSDFTLSVYLDMPTGSQSVPLLVRRYMVGLGEFDSTPVGVWRVEKMEFNQPWRNPRNNELIQPESQDYPLGRPGRWIGLEGIFGDAVGQHGYGIHGTNQPDSIGKQKSLGCIRMLDKDVSELWFLMRIADKPDKPDDPPPPFCRVTVRP
ncbi:MAG: hypothetical protein BIFFINMI_01914 [Phycisphaerae bacterium]|nr:hypothetical protein [Phycisphaerae bacterium]